MQVIWSKKVIFFDIFFNFFIVTLRVSFIESGWLNSINQHMQIPDGNNWISIDIFRQIKLALFQPLAPDRIAIAFPAQDFKQFPPPADEDEVMA